MLRRSNTCSALTHTPVFIDNFPINGASALHYEGTARLIFFSNMSASPTSNFVRIRSIFVLRRCALPIIALKLLQLTPQKPLID
jgi:hypothetical protein